MSQSAPAPVALRSAQLQAQISPVGAQLSILRDNAGRDLLWDGDPAVWAGRAPILFPIVGALAGGSYRLGDKSYALPRHGFARGKPFGVMSASSSAAVFRLQADATTLPVYPFQFQLDVGFQVDGPSLSVISTVTNQGSSEMPASIGYHPGFRWPLPFGQPRESHFIEFAEPEPSPSAGSMRRGWSARNRIQLPYPAGGWIWMMHCSATTWSSSTACTADP